MLAVYRHEKAIYRRTRCVTNANVQKCGIMKQRGRICKSTADHHIICKPRIGETTEKSGSSAFECKLFVFPFLCQPRIEHQSNSANGKLLNCWSQFGHLNDTNFAWARVWRGFRALCLTLSLARIFNVRCACLYTEPPCHEEPSKNICQRLWFRLCLRLNIYESSALGHSPVNSLTSAVDCLVFMHSMKTKIIQCGDLVCVALLRTGTWPLIDGHPILSVAPFQEPFSTLSHKN